VCLGQGRRRGIEVGNYRLVLRRRIVVHGFGIQTQHHRCLPVVYVVSGLCHSLDWSVQRVVSFC